VAASFGAKFVSFDATDKKVKGVTDVVKCPKAWPSSPRGRGLRCRRRALKVQWDESASGPRPDALLTRYRAQAAQPGAVLGPTTAAAPAPVKTVEACTSFHFLPTRRWSR
jgi:hypothetical protein